MITDTKLIVVNIVIRYGYNAFFSDVDLVFIRDPWPHLHFKVYLAHVHHHTPPIKHSLKQQPV